MCGICGKLNFNSEASISPVALKAMADTIRHRGPDDEGFFIEGPIGLGFRRLSIIDLSGGHQPLSNEDGRIWIVFNGEIYNYKELREFLLTKGHVFSTQSDTEVIVHLYEEFGEACVEKLRGMFGFAIWDDRRKSLLLARDRLGIKPLYYCLSEDSVVFGSEIKAILADGVKTEVDPAILDRFLTFYYVPGEETLLRGIRKLAPGSYMVVSQGKHYIRQYWDLHFAPSAQSLGEAEARLSELLEESVRLHMISDVPVGFLLSGGVDSTAMLGFAVGKTGHPLSSYTIGFSDPSITDERPFARLVASAFGSHHHEMTISSRDFVDFLPQYIWHMEEPVCEPPAVALYYVSKLAKSFVKVLISGEGGDEAFAGYSNYRTMLWLERLKSFAGPVNGPIASSLSAAGRLIGFDRLSRYAPLFGVPFEDYYYSRTSTPFEFFNSHMSDLYSSDFVGSIDKAYSLGAVTKYLHGANGQDKLSKMLYVDTKTWLPDDLLIKADKMTMANSIELRVPLLDHKVLEFASSLPGNFKVHQLTTKYILKKILRRRVPKEILDRRKAGFPVPCDTWLRTDLKDWFHDILLDPQTLSRGYFQRVTIEKLLSEQLRTGAFSKEVFSLATLEMWHRTFLKN